MLPTALLHSVQPIDRLLHLLEAPEDLDTNWASVLMTTLFPKISRDIETIEQGTQLSLMRWLPERGVMDLMVIQYP